MVVLDAALHILQLIQDGEHVDELAQGQKVGLGDKVLPPLSMAEPLHLTAEPLDGLALQVEGRQVRTGSPGGWLAVLCAESRIKTPSPGALVRAWTFRESQICQEIFLRGVPNPELISRGEPRTCSQVSQTNEFIHHAFAEKYYVLLIFCIPASRTVSGHE